MILSCPYCGAECVPGAIRCDNCGRILVRNKTDVKKLRTELAKEGLAGDWAVGDDEKRYLNSWQEARNLQLARKRDVFSSAISMVMNSFIASMAILAVSMLTVFILLIFQPEAVIQTFENMGWIEKPLIVVNWS